MRRLEGGLDSAAGGRGGTIFLAGETGMGRTFLARAALDLARARGFLVLEGQAYPLEGSLAYAPILDALGPFLRNLDPALQARLTSGLPDLGRLFADLRLPPAQPLGDPSLEKTRLFEAVSRLLERTSHKHPVVLFVDDLHWADAASVELLHYIARGLAGQRMLLLAGYRTDEVDPSRRIARLVASLRRAALCDEVSVGRLESGAIAELARDMLGGEPPAQLLALLSARTAGIPLFATALIRALLEARHLVRSGEDWAIAQGAEATMPGDVRDLILERLDFLDSDTRMVLDQIAVGGEASPHSLLRAASRLGDERLDVSLRRLLESGLVVEDQDGPDLCYRLAHPLVQEVAYGTMPEMLRRRAHAAFAAAIEQISHDDPSSGSPQALGRLARHYSRAGSEVDRNRALEVLLAAGDQAREFFANDQAAAYFGAALGLIREGYRINLLPSILEKLGEAWERVGEVGAAIAIWTEALAIRERSADLVAAARLRRLLALAEWDRGGFEAAQAHAAAGLESLAGQVAPQELANLLDARVLIKSRLGDAAGVAATAAELLSVAERSASPRAAAQAHLALVDVEMARSGLAGAREEFLLALISAEAAGEPLLVQRVQSRLIMAEFMLGNPGLGRQRGLLSVEMARSLGAPALELYPQTMLALLEFLAGDWPAALERSHQAAVLARRLGVPRGIAYAVGFRAILLAWRGDLAEAEACIAEVRATFGGDRAIDRPVRALDLAEAGIAMHREHYRRAQEIAAAMPMGGTDDGTLPFRLALAGEAQAALGSVESALCTARALLALSPCFGLFPVAAARFVEGLAFASNGQSDLALASLAVSAKLFTDLEMRFERARARLEWARVASATDPAAAIDTAGESLATFEQIGAQRYTDRARAILRNLGVRTTKTHRATTASSALSAREMEVARLVAQGLTNAEIANRLVLSPRTVTTHLEHIYARLGLGSRQSLIQYVARSDNQPPSDHNT